MSQSSERSPTPGACAQKRTGRPIKLRSACDRCCAAKVRCTSEPTGCQRCIANDTECQYQESMVGRVQGNRSKKRRVEEGQQQNNNSSASENASTASTTASSVRSTSLPSTDEESLGQWPHSSRTNPPDGHDFLLDESAMGNNFDFTTSLEELGLEPVAAPFVAPAPIQPPPPQAPPTPLTQSSNSTPPRPQDLNDSDFVIACTRVVIALETYIKENSKSFNIVMWLVQTALEKLVHLSSTPYASSGIRCTIHLVTIMYQVVLMLERLAQMLSEDTKLQEGGVYNWQASSSLSLPGLGLGELGVIAEEDITWRCQKMATGVLQASQALQTLKSLAAAGTHDSESGAASSKEACFKDLELKLSNLFAHCQRGQYPLPFGQT